MLVEGSVGAGYDLADLHGGFSGGIRAATDSGGGIVLGPTKG